MIISRNPTLEVLDGSVITRAVRGAWIPGYEAPETPGTPGYPRGSIVRVDGVGGVWSLHVSLGNNNTVSPVGVGQTTWFEIARYTPPEIPEPPPPPDVGLELAQAFRGVWSSATTYSVGDIVRVDTATAWSLHVSLVNNNTNITPISNVGSWFEIVTAATAAQGALSVVTHGSVNNVPRPPGSGAVYWHGSVPPLNRLPGDLWFDTSMV